MKKTISSILAWIICFGLCACGSYDMGDENTPDITPSKGKCNHSWRDATCFQPRTCDICGATEGGLSDHTWKDATYSEPKTCIVCGTTEGSKLPPVIAPNDTTAPELVSFTLDKTNVKVGDVIAVKENFRENELCKTLVADLQDKVSPKWLEVDKTALTAKVVAAPARDELDYEVNEQLIVEFYSK